MAAMVNEGIQTWRTGRPLITLDVVLNHILVRLRTIFHRAATYYHELIIEICHSNLLKCFIKYRLFTQFEGHIWLAHIWISHPWKYIILHWFGFDFLLHEIERFFTEHSLFLCLDRFWSSLRCGVNEDRVMNGVSIDLHHSRPNSIVLQYVKSLMCHKLSIKSLDNIFVMGCCEVVEEEGSGRHLHLLLYSSDGSVVEYLAYDLQLDLLQSF